MPFVLKFEKVIDKRALDLIALSPAKVERAIRDLLEDEAREQTRWFDKVTKTWSHKPVWSTTISQTGDDAELELSTNDGPFVWVALGTSRRRKVRVTKNWRAKTKPRVLGSVTGRGIVRQILPEMGPGIKAREWHIVLASRRQSQFTKAGKKMIRKLLK